VVVAVRRAAKLEVGFPFCLKVSIYQHDRVAAISLAADELGMLPAFNKLGGIGIRTIRGRNRAVVFLDASLHFCKQSFLQLFSICHFACCVSVFGFQIRADLRIKYLRVAHNLLPVVCAQPGIRLVAGKTVMAGFVSAHLSARWNWFIHYT